jgi:hypothetical protein
VTNLNTASRPIISPVRAHEHAWIVESGHATSLGRVLYVRCGECGTRRVDVQEHGERPPIALSSEIVRSGIEEPAADPR